MRKRYCCYGHVAPDGTVFYVGCGRAERPLSIQIRNEKWWDTVYALDHYDVRIFLSSDSADEVAQKERELIEELKPSCNLIGGGCFNPVEHPFTTLKRLVPGDYFVFKGRTPIESASLYLGKGKYQNLINGQVRHRHGTSRVLPLQQVA